MPVLQVCRILPWTVSNYKLDELITVRDLRRNVAEQFQKHSKVTNPQVSTRAIYTSHASCNCHQDKGDDMCEHGNAGGRHPDLQRQGRTGGEQSWQYVTMSATTSMTLCTAIMVF